MRHSPHPPEPQCLFFTYHRGRKSVLRKKPAGQLLSSTAHQVEREYRVLNALHNHNIKPNTPPEKRVPVPQPYILCEDSTVIGTPFYIMEFLDGRIFTNVYTPQLNPKDRREWCVGLVSECRLWSDGKSVGLLQFVHSAHCLLSLPRNSVSRPLVHRMPISLAK